MKNVPSRPLGGRNLGALSLLFATACGGASPAGPPAPAAVDFVRFADSVLASPPLHRAHIGVEVYDPVAKRVLYAHNAERHFVPASNQKYWPTTTALQVLGPDYRYRTPILAVAFDEVAGTTETLVVVGRGDPTFSERFHAPDPVVLDSLGDTVAVQPDPWRSQRRDWAVLDSLADSVVASGLRHITGDLVVDASWFDESIIPGSWTFGNLNGTSAPPTGAFVVGEGVFRVRVEPGTSVGSPALVEPWAPTGSVPLRNEAVTASVGAEGRVSTSRGPWNDTLRVAGPVALDAEPRVLRLPMTDPVRFAGHAFAEALRERGVTVDGVVRVVRDSTEAAALRAGRAGVAPTGDGDALSVRELTSWTSPPMSEIVRNILQPSQNWIAEQLVRTLGAERGEGGGWRSGIAVEEDFLFNTVGIDSTALSLQDGSGMSHQNLVTPHAVVQLLEYGRTAPWSQVFRDALTGPGRPGTLSRRLQGLDGRVTGKTGTLSNVNALSGYVRTRDGRELIFSILSNASGLGGGPVVSAIDRMVDALANGTVPR